jgi:hypothetical protein
VVVACRTGVSPADWLEDPRALVTAAQALEEADKAQKRRRR